MPVHAALRRFGYLCDIQELGTFDNEVLALVEEIKAIEKLKPEFNASIGGEGKHFRIYDKIEFNGEKRLAVEYLAVRDEKNRLAIRKRKKQLKQSQQYLLKVMQKASTRYRKLEKEINNHKLKIVPQPTEPSLDTEHKREKVYEFVKQLSLRHKTVSSMDEKTLAFHSFVYDWQIEFLDAKEAIKVRMAAEQAGLKQSKMTSKAKSNLKRIATVKRVPAEIRKKINLLSSQPKILQETKWFYDACSKNIFQSGDGILFQLNAKERQLEEQQSYKKGPKLRIIPVKKALKDTRETIYWVNLFDKFFDNYEMPSDEYIYIEKGYSPSDYIYSVIFKFENELGVDETADTLIEIKVDIYQCFIDHNLYILENQSLVFINRCSR